MEHKVQTKSISRTSLGGMRFSRTDVRISVGLVRGSRLEPLLTSGKDA